VADERADRGQHQQHAERGRGQEQEHAEGRYAKSESIDVIHARRQRHGVYQAGLSTGRPTIVSPEAEASNPEFVAR